MSKEEAAKAAAPTPDVVATARISLKKMWDASLTFDLLDDPHDRAENDDGPIFVGRDELLGSLVNAIGQPDRRGTYLVSGYRGVGKTSLIIQASRLARSQLQADGWRLLPLVLNVSEVSASLESPSAVDSSALQIDARRLLTALLRTLRNRVPTSTTRKSDSRSSLAEKIQWAYQKAEATRYTETQQQRAEAVDTAVRESKRMFAVHNFLKLVAGVAVLAAAAVEGIALLGSTINRIHLIAIALLGVAIFSFQRSVVLTKKSTQSASGSSELVRDNSVHQLESELKDILEELHKGKFRTIIILEELDKIHDQQGQQLDSVIRYFKNLFTQAPALFFFLTDKAYYDIISKKIELERSRRSYAVEHTFFTHRLFVSRPGIEECLKYMIVAFSKPDDSSQVEGIARSQGYRVRSLEEMLPLEQFIRTLLFRSQDHFFDLKNEMRQFVRVNESGSWLEFDEVRMPKSDRALAAFQFLVEQKMLSYSFGGGNDYSNEELRNYLFAVFGALGSPEPQQIASFYPKPDTDSDSITLDQCRRIIEAVDSLIEDLERGGAIKRQLSDPGAAGNGQEREIFVWRERAAVSFAPVARAEPHEDELFEYLSRIAGWAESSIQRGLLGQIDDSATRAKALSTRLSHQVEEMRRSPVAIPIEDVINRRREAEKEVAPFQRLVFTAHQKRLMERYQLDLTPSSKTTPPRALVLSGNDSESKYPILLMYESFGQDDGEELPWLQTPDHLERRAIIYVVLDGSHVSSRQLPMGMSVTKLIPEELNERSFLVRVPFHENLEPEAIDDRWGERTADELRFAQLWRQCENYEELPVLSSSEPTRTYALHTSDKPAEEMQSFKEAFSAWLETGDTVLAWSQYTGPRAGMLEKQVAFSSINQSTIVVVSPDATFLPRRKLNEQEEASLGRLRMADRVVFQIDDHFGSHNSYELLRLSPGGRVLLQTTDTDWLSPKSGLRGVSVVHLKNSGVDPMGIVRLVRGRYPDYAVSLLKEATESGDMRAVAELVVLLADRNPEEARAWQTRLAQLGDNDEILNAAGRIEDRHPEDAAELYRPLAEAGDMRAVAELVVLLADRKPEEARTWRTRLAQSGKAESHDEYVILGAAGRIEDRHPEDAAELYQPLAEAGSTRAAMKLVVLLADRNPEEARTWQTRLAQSGDNDEILNAAGRIEDRHPEDAAELYRPLAEAGNMRAATELVVLLADRNPEEARTWRTRLAQSGKAESHDEYVILGAAGRIEDRHPEDAAELYRPLAEAGSTPAMAELVVLLADRKPEEARTWRTRLAQSGKAESDDEYVILGAAGRIEDRHPEDAAELYRPLAEAGSTRAATKLVVLLADRNPEEARTWQTRLGEETS